MLNQKSLVHQFDLRSRKAIGDLIARQPTDQKKRVSAELNTFRHQFLKDLKDKNWTKYQELSFLAADDTQQEDLMTSSKSFEEVLAILESVFLQQIKQLLK